MGARTVKAGVAALVAIIALGLVLISLWPDRRYAPEWPYRLGLFNGRPTIEHCEESPVRVVFSCWDVFDHANGVLDIDTDEDGVADVRAVIHHPRAEFYELGAVPMPIPEHVFLERTTGSPTGRVMTR